MCSEMNSSSHWDYYSYGNIKDDSYISKCFDYIEWDVEMIEKNLNGVMRN